MFLFLATKIVFSLYLSLHLLQPQPTYYLNVFHGITLYYTIFNIQVSLMAEYCMECVTNTIFRPKYKYQCTGVKIFVSNILKKILGWIVLATMTFNNSDPILLWVRIYLDVPKKGECEYKYYYTDWFLQIKIQLHILT